MNWVIIVVLIVLAFVFLRMKHMKHKLFLIILIFALLFIYTSGSRVLARQDINWKSMSGIEKGVKVYFAWLGGVFDNLKVITANAIKMDWSRNATGDVRVEER